MATSPSGCRQAQAAWHWWQHVLKNPKYICPPMVHQSEAAFRTFVRDHGIDFGFTPMWHACRFKWADDGHAKSRVEVDGWLYDTQSGERPLIAQLCAVSADEFIYAAKQLEPFVDGIDLNLGCPQPIAAKTGFGAYLMDDLPNIKDMLTRACQELKVPISAKIRIFPELQDTLNYVRMIEECGVYMITVHGRLRQQRHHQGQPDYDAIKAIVDIASVPVVANGNICSKQHADEVMAYTGAHAVMSATALLYRPTLYADADYYEISNARFHEKREVLTSVESLLRTQHAWQYLDYAERTRPPYFRYIRDHVVTLVKPMLFDQGMLDLFDMLHRNLNVCSIEQYRWLLLHLFHRLDCSLCQERVRAESQLREAGVARRKACAKARAAAAKPELDDTESNDTAEQLMRLVEELQLEHDNIAVCITAQLLPSLKHIRNMKGELNCGFELPVELSEIL